jgi:hypothetical protein
MVDSPARRLNIQLGDIIEIQAPTDDDLNNKQFIIQYLDNNLLIITGTLGKERTLLIGEDGMLRNESITSISILNRPDFPGYAQQNKLVPNTWIDIHFGGDIPTIITGKITNLEEDQIEITTYGDNDVIYIDFAYKGIPQDIPIEEIIIRNEPDDLNTGVPEENLESVEQIEDEYEENQDDVSTQEVKEQIRDIILQADQIIIGEKLGSITQFIDVPEEEQRFGLNKQTNDLLDDLLSTIPNAQRTDEVLNNIHLMIDRFIQLRDEFSVFNNVDNTISPRILGANYKPLVQNLIDLNQKLYWILPVVKMKKKLYDVDIDVQEEYDDIVPVTLANYRIEEQSITDTYNENDVPDGENKYIYLLRSLQPFLTPYDNPNDPDTYLTSKQVQTSITAVVDNLEEFYSSVSKNDDIRRKRFLMQVYSLGQNMLHSTRGKNGDIVISERKVTNNDVLTMKSILTLPEPIVRFSHINLPATNILDKTNLNIHFLSYWRILQKTSIVNTKFVSNLTEQMNHDEDTYLNGITEYVLDPSIKEEETYDKYLNTIVPKTRVLFNLIKSYIKGGLSVYGILQYLEPFMIYQKDISFKQYEVFVLFINERIKDYKKNYANSNKDLSRLPVKSEQLIPSYINLLNESNDKDEVAEAYKLDKIPSREMIFNELWLHSNSIDNNILYNAAIASGSIPLMTPNGVEQLEEIDNWVKKSETEINEQKDDCDQYDQYVLSKKYLAIDEMEEDNGKDIYFDKQYDTTYYDLIKDYERDLKTLPEESTLTTKIELIAQKLIQNNGLSEENARRDARALIEKRRLVENGDYAVVILENDDSSSTNDDSSSTKDHNWHTKLYYKRRDNTWERDVNISSDTFTDKTKFFCDLNTNCIQIENQCQTNDSAATLIKNNNLKQLIHEFDDRLMQNKSQLENYINRQLENSLKRCRPLEEININLQYKYNNKRYAIGGGAEIKDIPTSPYEKIRDAILGQGDFVKRQMDIGKFVSLWTRPPNDDEDEHWLYCISSNIKLLPIFLSTLADAYSISVNNYINAIATICKTQGTLSDDQDYWVDKHSGYTIVPIDFDNEEGFTEDGFKIQSRQIMEADAGEALIQIDVKKQKFESKDAQSVFNIVNAVSTYMGIDVEPFSEFIVRNVLKSQARAMPSREKYEFAIEGAKKRGKKNLDSYEIAFNQSLILLSLDYLLISVQTSIPSINTKKRHPGCVRSFSGFPLSGIEDKTGLTYIACIAHKIKGSYEPWNSIKKLSQISITKKMEAVLNKYVITNNEVEEKLVDKREYQKLNKIDAIPLEHSINNWINFLPQLNDIKLGIIENVSEGFLKQLKANLKDGSKEQFVKIDIMRSKIIFFALKFQEYIQKIIEKKSAILTNSVSEPFLENSCCDGGDTNTMKYFISEQPDIAVANNNCLTLQNILDDLGRMAKAPYLFDPSDTKFNYPKIPDEFSEEIIYRAFIVYCKYNTDVPLSEDLRSVCMSKPETFDIHDSIEEKIKKLKRDGHNYSVDSFNQLMKIVNSKNIVHFKLHSLAVNNIQILRELLENFDERDVQNIPVSFREKFLAMIDTFELGGLTEDTEEMRDMKNYLSSTNESMHDRIIDFIQRNLTSRLPSKLFECINNIEQFKEYENNMFMDNEDETIFKMINFIKDSIRTLVNVLPNVVINKVDYRNVKIPTHWKLSEIHNNDLKAILNKHYEKLYQLFDDDAINMVLNKVQLLCKDLTLLVDNTFFFAPIQSGDTYLYSVFDRRLCLLIFKHYFYSILVEYISLVDDEDIILRLTSKPAEMLSDALQPSMSLLDDEADELISNLEVASGEKKLLSEKIANVLSIFVNIICNDKKTIDYNYSTLMERIHRAKEKEKDVITTYLKDLTDEEREVESLFKNSRLGKWSKGLQKGLRVYQKDTYDEERDTLESQTLIDMKLGKSDLVTNMNRNIYAMDAIAEQSEQALIEMEELNMQLQPDDDDYGDNDGDEQFY